MFIDTSDVLELDVVGSGLEQVSLSRGAIDIVVVGCMEQVECMVQFLGRSKEDLFFDLQVRGVVVVSPFVFI